jgi:hypothetical protein
MARGPDKAAGTLHSDQQAGEFPGGLGPPMSRRDALRLMGATSALAAAAGATGMAGCGGQPPETIVPFSQPDRPELMPGKPVFYATSLTRGGAGGAGGAGGVGLGVLVESRMGRPIKVEGNPEHPSSLGATDVWAQAAVLDLYDPERLKAPKRGGMVASWQAVEAELASVRERVAAAGGVGAAREGTGAGGGLRILTGRISSPTLLAELGRALAQFPGARWHEHEPVSDASERRGVRMATGRDGQDGRVRYRVGRADVIVSFDDDFLYQRAGSVRHAREFADGRRLRSASSTMNRLYVCEPSPSVTGSNADHRLAAGPSRVEALLRALARDLGVHSPLDGAQDGLSEAERAWLAGAAEDLRQAGQGGLVCVGHALSAPAHALGLAINQQLGALGRTVEVVAAEDRPQDPAGEGVIEPGTLAELVEAMRAGEVGRARGDRFESRVHRAGGSGLCGGAGGGRDHGVPVDAGGRDGPGVSVAPACKSRAGSVGGCALRSGHRERATAAGGAAARITICAGTAGDAAGGGGGFGV